MIEERSGEGQRKPILGAEDATLDDKRRLLVSKKKRDRLGYDFVMAMGPNARLCAYPLWRWEEVVREIGQYSPINPGRQEFSMLISDTAEDDLNFDAQGRVVVPGRLVKLGRVGSRVKLVGAIDRLEVWPLEEYERHEESVFRSAEERQAAVQRAYDRMVSG